MLRAVTSISDNCPEAADFRAFQTQRVCNVFSKLNELRQSLELESLDQQTATSEVLGVISASPGELEPVFQAILENATRICGASFGNLLLSDGDTFRVAAMHGGTPEWNELRRRNPTVCATGNHPLGRAVATKQLQHVADLKTEPSYLERDPSITAIVDVAGARTILMVPMLKENRLVGTSASTARKSVRSPTSRSSS